MPPRIVAGPTTRATPSRLGRTTVSATPVRPITTLQPKTWSSSLRGDIETGDGERDSRLKRAPRPERLATDAIKWRIASIDDSGSPCEPARIEFFEDHKQPVCHLFSSHHGRSRIAPVDNSGPVSKPFRELARPGSGSTCKKRIDETAFARLYAPHRCFNAFTAQQASSPRS